jgi:hypothetical protein
MGNETIDRLAPTEGEAIALLLQLSEKLKLTHEEILSLYMVLGSGIFCMLDTFQGKTVKFPAMGTVRSLANKLGGCFVVEIPGIDIMLNGVIAPKIMLEAGDIVNINGKIYLAKTEALGFLDKSYFIGEELKEGTYGT